MKIGNVSQTVLKRSVLKPLKACREEVFISPTVEELCGGIRLEAGELLIEASDTVYGDEKDLGIYGVAKVVNHIASRGGEPIGVDVTIQLPPHAYESRLKAMVEYIEKSCSAQQMQVMKVRVSVSPVIQSAIIHITGFGSVTEDRFIQMSMAKSGQEIVLINTIGTEGALRILNKKREELEARFISTFFYKFEKQKEQLVIREGIRLGLDYRASAIHPIGEGGILAALWELGEAAGLGMELEIKKMSILQETIEICEYMGVNPYQLSSNGSALVVVPEGEPLVRALRQKGYVAEVIGHTTDKRERVMVNGEEKRFLDRPAPDELLKLYQEV